MVPCYMKTILDCTYLEKHFYVTLYYGTVSFLSSTIIMVTLLGYLE